MLVEDWTDDMDGLLDSDERTVESRPAPESAIKAGNEGQIGSCRETNLYVAF
jgi:hypothetical protein